jgi:hypothetical protein
MFPAERLFAEIRPSIFRILTIWDKPDGGSEDFSIATGFVVAVYRDTRRLVIATAKHVLDVPDDRNVKWRFDQFDETGNLARSVQFATNRSTKGAVPYRTHNDIDVGIFVLPTLGSDKTVLARPDESPVRVVGDLDGVAPSTRVAWAGFPGVVEMAIGYPQLCYFEGVVSAQVDRPGKRFYVVDGHVSHGVSGGPVWHWNEEKDRLEVVGLVSSYHTTPAGDGIPGFCFFEPINSVVGYLGSSASHPDTTGDHVIVNRAA